MPRNTCKNTCQEMLFLPMDMEGKGLQSLQLETDTMRVQSKMKLLNSGGGAGGVVRAVKDRFETRSEKGTIQYHTAEAMKRGYSPKFKGRFEKRRVPNFFHKGEGLCTETAVNGPIVVVALKTRSSSQKVRELSCTFSDCEDRVTVIDVL